MSFTDWATESVERYRENPTTTATKESLAKLLKGVNRRTLDNVVGEVWWERDWDVLVVLDAMRVDLAQDVVDDDIDSVWSPASTSIDWINTHFSRKYKHHWENAGYVTANPFAEHNFPDTKSADLQEKPLGYLDLVYKRGFQDVGGGVKTTPPHEVTDAAISAWRNEGIDRMVVHYMQPHQPFRTRPEWDTANSNLENLIDDEADVGGPDIWKRCRDGEMDKQELWEAYRDNLEWVLKDVEERLFKNIDGDVTITADHGNGMGEYGVWSHPPGTLVPSVRKVPVWNVRASDERTVEVDTRSEERTQSNIDEQLEALGYK